MVVKATALLIFQLSLHVLFMIGWRHLIQVAGIRQGREKTSRREALEDTPDIR